jgi:hypothetical protein
MEIKKADSKGRVTGFEPGRYYQVVQGENGKILVIPSPIHDAVAEDLAWLVTGP